MKQNDKRGVGKPRPDAKRADEMLRIIRRGMSQYRVRYEQKYDPDTHGLGKIEENPDYIPFKKFNFTPWSAALMELIEYCRLRGISTDTLEDAVVACENNSLAQQRPLYAKLMVKIRIISAEVASHFREESMAFLKSSAKPNNQKRMSGELNMQVHQELRKNPKASSRQIAKIIGCSHTTVEKTPAFQAVNEERKKGRKPQVRTLTENDADARQEELNKLTEEQKDDAKSDGYSRRLAV